MSYISNNSKSNYDKYRDVFISYTLIYKNILLKKGICHNELSLILDFSMFLIEKHYFLQDYIIEKKDSFFDTVKWYLETFY